MVVTWILSRGDVLTRESYSLMACFGRFSLKVEGFDLVIPDGFERGVVLGEGD